MPKVYNVVCMIFYPYTPGQLAKIRNTEDIGESKLYYEVGDNTNIGRETLKNFLSNEATKRDLKLYLSKKFLHHFSGRFTHCYAIPHNKLFIDEEPTPLVTFKHDEADTLLIWYSIYCKLRFGDNIYIDMICSNTDVLLLLLNFALQLLYNTIFCSLSYSITIGILYKALGRKECEGPLSLHVLTACDRTGRFSGKGKCAWFHKFCAYNNDIFYAHMKSFGEEKELSEEMIEGISAFISFVYRGKQIVVTGC